MDCNLYITLSYKPLNMVLFILHYRLLCYSCLANISVLNINIYVFMRLISPNHGKLSYLIGMSIWYLRMTIVSSISNTFQTLLLVREKHKAYVMPDSSGTYVKLLQ